MEIRICFEEKRKEKPRIHLQPLCVKPNLLPSKKSPTATTRTWDTPTLPPRAQLHAPYQKGKTTSQAGTRNNWAQRQGALLGNEAMRIQCLAVVPGQGGT